MCMWQLTAITRLEAMTGALGSQQYFIRVGTSPRERKREKNGITRLKGPGPDPLPKLPL